MSQTSLYVLGDCYMKNSQLSLASQMFHEAYKMKIDPEITEDALYNYAKLQYETSNQPFNTAIGALEEYITQYPYSTEVMKRVVICRGFTYQPKTIKVQSPLWKRFRIKLRIC